MAEKKRNSFEPEDFIKNFSPAKRALLYFSSIRRTNTDRLLYPGLDIIKRIYLTFLTDPNDSEINKILPAIHERKGKPVDNLTSFLSEKFKEDHLRKFEYSFQARCLFDIGIKNKTIVDMGGGFGYSTIIPLLLDPAYAKVISVDYANYPRKSKYPIQYVTGDCMNTNLPSNYADVVTLISTLEHVGLGRYGDPMDPDGDVKAVKEARRILKRKGHLILTVPYGYPSVVFNLHRIYDEGRIAELTKSFKLIGRQYTCLGKMSSLVNARNKKPSKIIPGYYLNVKNRERMYNPQCGVMLLLQKP